MLRSFAQHIQQSCTGEQEINIGVGDGKRKRGINREIKGRKKAAGDGKDRGRARRWMEPKIGQLIDLLEEKDCLWDVSKKDYHVRNKRERAFEEMRNNLDIDVAEIKAKITSLHAQLG